MFEANPNFANNFFKNLKIGRIININVNLKYAKL